VKASTRSQSILWAFRPAGLREQCSVFLPISISFELQKKPKALNCKKTEGLELRKIGKVQSRQA
jgi:hypothetical protein